MKQFSSALEVYKLLAKTNCKECGEKTCLAFAGAVYTGDKELFRCPYVGDEQIERYGGDVRGDNPVEKEFLNVINNLKDKLSDLDFHERAERVGGHCHEDRITLPIMGKPVTIDKKGTLFTDIHANNWVLVTVLCYINSCQGHELSGRWVPLRELPGGKDWYRLFGQQCEQVMKKTADTYPELFSDIVEIFRGKQVDGEFASDVAVVIFPLPRVPMLICYWKPEDGMESSLNLMFDDSAEENLGMDGLYTLGVGIARMFEQIARQHGTGM